jgi:hypothetical protein
VKATESVLKTKSEELETAMVLWEPCFRNDVFDQSFAQSRILDNASRPLVKPWTKFLQIVSNDMANFTSSWGTESTLRPSIRNFVDTTVSAANVYLVIVAGINTVLHFSDAPKGNQMASTVLDCASKIKQFELPKPLYTKLKELKEGAPPTAARPPIEPSTTTTVVPSGGVASSSGPATAVIASSALPPTAIVKTEGSSASSGAKRQASIVEAVPPTAAKRQCKEVAPSVPLESSKSGRGAGRGRRSGRG